MSPQEKRSRRVMAHTLFEVKGTLFATVIWIVSEREGDDWWALKTAIFGVAYIVSSVAATFLAKQGEP